MINVINVKMLKQKKSQLTIFLIIGMVVLVLLGFLFYGLASYNSEKIETETEVIRQSANANVRYNAYIKSCIEQAAKEGIALIGQQGGFVFNKNYPDPTTSMGFQFPSMPNTDANSKIYKNPLTISNTEFSSLTPELYVPFWLTAPDLSYAGPSPVFHPAPPKYPYGNVVLVENPGSKYFGNFPKSYNVPLCDTYGANAVAAISCGTYKIAYDSNAESDKHSIQEYLQEYIREKALPCINIDKIEVLKGYDITEKNVFINVTIGETNVITRFSIPHLLTQKTTKGTNEETSKVVQQLQDITVPVNVRLKQMHELVYYMLENDMTNIFFNVNKDYKSVDGMLKCLSPTGTVIQCAREGMEVFRVSGVKDSFGKQHSIIKIRDNLFKLDGKPYEFQVAVENRIPALDWIQNDEVMKDKGLITFNTDGSVLDASVKDKVDVVGFVGVLLELDPKAYDPDEDYHGIDNAMNATYYYEGWGIDLIDVNIIATVDDPALYLECEGISGGGSHLENAKNLLDPDSYINLFCIIKNHPEVSVHPQTLPFLIEKQQNHERRILKYTPSKIDIGLHTTKIKMCDNEQNCDWQDIRILILP